MPTEGDIGQEKGKDGDNDDGESELIVGHIRPCRPEVEEANADKGKGDGVRASHPLAMLGYLAVARGEKSGECAEDPRSGLDVGGDLDPVPLSKDESDACRNENGKDINATEDAVQPEVLLPDAR